LRSDAINVAQSEILDGLRATARDPRLIAQTPAARPDTMNPNIKAVKVVHGGKEFTEFYGAHFVKAMGRPGRKVVGFNTSSGFVNCQGWPVR
jgi:hypothetical protein